MAAVSFLFGGVRGHGDPELAAANRRQREHFARDINDRSVFTDRGEPIPRRRTGWVLLGVVTAFFLGVAFLGGGSDPVPITRSCTTPALVAAAPSAAAGTTLAVRSTGPQDAQYILSIDGEPVQGQADQTVTYGQTPAGPAYSLIDCVSPAFTLPLPVDAGVHEIALQEYAAGTARQVAAVSVTITG